MLDHGRRGLFVLALGACALFARPAAAHPIVVDGSAADWRGVTGIIPDLGRIARDSVGGGEFVWRDAVGDQRAVWPARPHDLRELRVTGDAFNLYIMAVLAGPVATSGDSVPQLQVALDLDRFGYSGAMAFPSPAATSTAANAAYELLVQTRFGSGQAPRILDANGAVVATAAAARISAAGVIEISSPWTALGSPYPLDNPVRFTTALFLTDAADQPYDPADGATSRAADVVTQNSGPGTTGTTLAEVSDGTIDYWFDVYFDARGNAISPIVVSELWFSGGIKSEWIEIVNASQNLVPLTAYKVGESPSPGNGQSMSVLPSAYLSPGDNFVIARNGSTFFTNNGFRAGAETETSDPATPDLLPDYGWSSTTLFNINAAGFDVLVLDPCNTVVDVVVYKNASWPGVKPQPGVQSSHSLERTRPDKDTDDCAADFGDEPVPTPGVSQALAAVGPGGSTGRVRWSPPAPNPARGFVALALTLDHATRVRVDVIDTNGRRIRTLVAGEVRPAGALHLTWDGRDERGVAAQPGLYFVRASTPAGMCAVRVGMVR
jgi:hypothetical protein